VKYLVLILIFIESISAYGQKITGFVTDKTNKQPISGALVTCGAAKTYTGSTGQFEITLSAKYDSLRITQFGYKSYSLLPGKPGVALHIELEPKIISLKTVTVHGDLDFKADSIRNRAAWAKQFNYTGPTVMDAFRGSTNGQPFEFISINPLVLIAALTKKSSPEYKFKKMLIIDEHEQYVDEHFNKGIVSRVTGLKGDTLSVFLTQYRPAYEFVKKSTDYEIEVYIKQSLEKFKKEGFSAADPFSKISHTPE